MEQFGRGLKLTTNPHLPPRLRMGGDILLFFVYVHGLDRGKFTFINLRTLWGGGSVVKLTPRPP